MALLTWQQLHGVNELVQGAVEATTNAVADVDRVRGAAVDGVVFKEALGAGVGTRRLETA